MYTKQKLIRKSARGQSLAVVGLLLGLGVLIGLVAIAVDGGSALLQRRVMQNSADAGALAGIDFMMDGNLAVSCNSPCPGCVPVCRPTYLITNAQLRQQVEALAIKNRGGAIGATAGDYTVGIEYHYMVGAVFPAPCSDCYLPAPNDSNYMPEFVDGLRITAGVLNPTTFARALPVPITDLQVSAVAAGRLYPTCAPQPGEEESPLPFVRFRPALEREIVREGNNICSPYIFWQSQGDIGGGGSNFKNLISLNEKSAVDITNPDQLITEADLRHYPDDYPELRGNHNPQSPLILPEDPCPPDDDCADMRGRSYYDQSEGKQDIENWIYWEWAGSVRTTSLYPQLSMTWYPANASTNYGRGGGATQSRPGDWVETYGGQIAGGTWGEQVQGAVHDLAAFSPNAIVRPESISLNWGKAIRRTVYVWGDRESELSTYPGRSAQRFERVNQPGCTPEPGRPCPQVWVWKDVDVYVQGRQFRADDDIGRVRLTHAYTFLFFENLQGGNYGANTQPPGCPRAFNTAGSQALGFIVNTEVPGPPSGGNCPTGWSFGGGVYGRQVQP